MRPPQWYLDSSRRLSLDEFAAEFAGAWSRLTSRFFKLECWQSYQELDSNKSLAAYNAGDLDETANLLQREAEADRPLYDSVRARGVTYARIRLVQLPLTPYLKYEIINYRIRREMGEWIEIVKIPSDVPLPNAQFFDFLLFDEQAALIHDYGDDGRQIGGWATRRPEVLRTLAEKAVGLRRQASSLAEFLKSPVS
jgi:Family of unknown function (DUF6879)